MRSKAAKILAGGEKITKIVTWDAIGQDDESDEINRSTSIFRQDTGLYHEDGLESEDGFRLSEVLDTDLVLEIHTARGLVWKSEITTVSGHLASYV